MTRKGIAKSTAEHCSKGDLIGIKGRLQTRSYVYDDIKRVVSEVVAEKVTFLSYNRNKDRELSENSTIRKFLIVQKEGDRNVERNVVHYNLQLIIAVGFKINNSRAVEFRKWASQIVKDYTIQGWTMDKDRIKSGHMFTDEYFEPQLQYIREIRLS